MKEKLIRIIESLEQNDKKYFIDDSGNIKERINEVYSEKTGFYINKNGEYIEETSALNFDQKTGIYENEEGDIKEEGIFVSNKTGYYKGDKNEYKKEGFFGRSYKQKQESSNESSVPQDDISTIFLFIKWGVIIAAALFIIMVAVFLAPIILLAWYLIKKREMQWVAIVGMVFSAYLIYDITSGGFITNSIMKMKQSGEEKYIALGYFVILVTTLGFFIDKYTSKKIPISESGNFFEQKNIKERRPFIAGFSVLLLTIFSIFQFVIFSSNNYNINNSNYNNQRQESPTNYSTSTNDNFNNNLLIGHWNISNQNNSSYNFSQNGKGNFINKNGKIFSFNWSIPNNNSLKIKLDVDNSIWNWNIESFSSNKIIMFSQQHNERRTITKGINNSNSGIINGTNVIMRDGHSSQSKIIGSFKNSGERVKILDSFYPNNNGETLIQREINVKTNIGTNYNLQKGKSVIILSRQNRNVKIQFKDKELRNLTTTINESYLDKSVNSKWYKVKRNSGEIGWVFGKFINI